MPPSFLRFSHSHHSLQRRSSPVSTVRRPTAAGVPLGSPTIEHLSHILSTIRRPASTSPPRARPRRRPSLTAALLPPPAAFLSALPPSSICCISLKFHQLQLTPAPPSTSSTLFSHRRRRSSPTIGSAVSSSEENLPQPFMSNSRNQNGRSLPPFGNFISYIHSRKHEVYAPATSLGPGYNSPKVMPEFEGFISYLHIRKHEVDAPKLEKHEVAVPKSEKHEVASPKPEKHEVAAPKPTYCVHSSSYGDWVISMMNHYDFPSDIKSMLAAKLLDNPSMFPLMVGFDEKTLLSFIRAVSHKGLFDTWYMEWTARN